MNEREKKYVHCLNSTLTATERTLCCIVENYQTPEGLRVPEVLQPFVGVDFIPYKTKITRDNKKVGARTPLTRRRDRRRERGTALTGGRPGPSWSAEGRPGVTGPARQVRGRGGQGHGGRRRRAQGMRRRVRLPARFGVCAAALAWLVPLCALVPPPSPHTVGAACRRPRVLPLDAGALHCMA